MTSPPLYSRQVMGHLSPTLKPSGLAHTSYLHPAPPPWLALPCCPGKVQATLLSAAAGEGCGQFCIAFRHQHVPSQQPRPGVSLWLLVVTDPCCFWDTDPDMTLVAAQDILNHGWSQVAPLATHIRLLLTTLDSSVLPSLCPHPSVFLFSVSTTYLLFLEVPRVSDYLGPSQEWF